MSLSGKGRRAKGLVGEREVATVFRNACLDVKNLEGGGDVLIVRGVGLGLHVEVKRQETIKIALWTAQAEEEAAPGTIPIVAYRRSREPWRVSLLLDDFVGLLR